MPSPVKKIKGSQSELVDDDDDEEEEEEEDIDVRKVITEYAVDHHRTMDAVEIVDDIHRHAEKLMHY